MLESWGVQRDWKRANAAQSVRVCAFDLGFKNGSGAESAIGTFPAEGDLGKEGLPGCEAAHVQVLEELRLHGAAIQRIRTRRRGLCESAGEAKADKDGPKRVTFHDAPELPTDCHCATFAG